MKSTNVDGNKVLILGSYPGEKSLITGEYYVDNRNKFWDLLLEVYGEYIAKDDLKAKSMFLDSHSIVLWDVCECCERNGSSDSGIVCEKPNKIVELIQRSNVEVIFCNGSKAFKLFNKFFKDKELINKSGRIIKAKHVELSDYYKLISSSGAANRFGDKRLLNWKRIKTNYYDHND